MKKTDQVAKVATMTKRNRPHTRLWGQPASATQPQRSRKPCRAERRAYFGLWSVWTKGREEDPGRAGHRTYAGTGLARPFNQKRVPRTNTEMQTTKTVVTRTLLGLTVAMAMLGAMAQAQSAKVTAKTAAMTLIPPTNTTSGWVTILANTIKTANQKDLFIGASLECGLYTLTKVASKNMKADTSVAEAHVHVRVLVDGNEAEPGEVVFARRSQELTAILEGAIGGCLSLQTNADGTTSIVVDETCVTPEVIEFIQHTMDANAFNWVAVDVPQGNHLISVQARIETFGAAELGQSEATATVGKGSMTVESVRLIKDPNVILDVP